MMKDWLHVTDQKFDSWIIPTPASPSKPELLRHTAAFLTKDVVLGKASGPLLCKSAINSSAKILNVLETSAASEAMRLKVIQGQLGRDHPYARQSGWWTEAWQQGLMMRFGTDNPAMLASFNRTQRLGRQFKEGNQTSETKDAYLNGQNLTREWIEELSVAASNLGYDVLLGREVHTYRPGGPAAPEVIFALTDKALTPPVWVRI